MEKISIITDSLSIKSLDIGRVLNVIKDLAKDYEIINKTIRFNQWELIPPCFSDWKIDYDKSLENFYYRMMKDDKLKKFIIIKPHINLPVLPETTIVSTVKFTKFDFISINLFKYECGCYYLNPGHKMIFVEMPDLSLKRTCNEYDRLIS